MFNSLPYMVVNELCIGGFLKPPKPYATTVPHVFRGMQLDFVLSVSQQGHPSRVWGI